MAHILDHHKTLVPTVKMNGHLQLSNADLLQIDDTTFFSILFGGDQLTVTRVRGIQAQCDTHDNRVDKFEGLLPVVEDWDARMTLLKVLLLL